MESFFKSFKVEEVYHTSYETREQATRAANEYIERFYHRTRLHCALGYVSPNEFEELRLFEKKPLQKNLWVKFGSGRAPRL